MRPIVTRTFQIVRETTLLHGVLRKSVLYNNSPEDLCATRVNTYLTCDTIANAMRSESHTPPTVGNLGR